MKLDLWTNLALTNWGTTLYDYDDLYIVSPLLVSAQVTVSDIQEPATVDEVLFLLEGLDWVLLFYREHIQKKYRMFIATYIHI